MASVAPTKFCCEVEYSSIISPAAEVSACAEAGWLQSWTRRRELRCLPNLGPPPGLILFLLRCGKLPFDDEYLPNMFKTILCPPLALFISFKSAPSFSADYLRRGQLLRIILSVGIAGWKRSI